jgi:hypothetical protein
VGALAVGALAGVLVWCATLGLGDFGGLCGPGSALVRFDGW